MFHLTRTAGVIEFGELLNQLLDQREGLFKKRLAYSNALNPHPLRRNFMREPWEADASLDHLMPKSAGGLGADNGQ